MEKPVVAVYDANVLYSAPLRDLCVRLAQAGLVRARWTDRIHDEWVRNVLANNPRLSADRLGRTRALMNEAVADSLVQGYEALIPKVSLPDPDDCHVLAAAIHIGAEVIVTYNLTDFPDDALKPYAIAAQHPDEFIAHLYDRDAEGVCRAAKLQRESLKKPPLSIDDFLAGLSRMSLSETVRRLAQSRDLL